MAGPWEDYRPAQPAAGAGPWSDYAGVEPEKPPKRTALGTIGDIGVSALKGAVAVPEAAVGIADIASGGRVGKFLENDGGAIGFRPKQAKAALDEFYSPAQQAANAAVQEADGFVPTLQASIANPSTIGLTAVESLGLMGAGGLVGRGITAAAPTVGRLMGIGAGEGVVAAGSQAESIRQQTDDGLLTPKQSTLAAGTGALTGAITAGSGRIANRLGIGDIDQMILTGQMGASAAKKGIIRRAGEGVLTEGVLEEMPQSAAEQAMQNLALDRPVGQGVGSAAAQGLLTGALMGGAAAPFVRQPTEAATQEQPPPEATIEAPPAAPAAQVVPDNGPLSRGVNMLAGQAPEPAEPIPVAQATELTGSEAARVQREADQPPAATGEVMQGDITRDGKPFGSMLSAQRALAKAGPGYSIAPVAGGLVLRPSGAQQAVSQFAAENDGPTTLDQGMLDPGFDARELSFEEANALAGIQADRAQRIPVADAEELPIETVELADGLPADARPARVAERARAGRPAADGASPGPVGSLPDGTGGLQPPAGKPVADSGTAAPDRVGAEPDRPLTVLQAKRAWAEASARGAGPEELARLNDAIIQAKKSPTTKAPNGTQQQGQPVQDRQGANAVPDAQAPAAAQGILRTDGAQDDGQAQEGLSARRKAVKQAKDAGLPLSAVVKVPGIGWTVNPQPTTMGPAVTEVRPAGTRGTSAADVVKAQPPAPAPAAPTVGQQATGESNGQEVQGQGRREEALTVPQAQDAAPAPASEAPGGDAGNGFKRGPKSGERYRVGVVDAVGGAVSLEKRLPGGTAATFYVGKDGNLVDGDGVNLIGDGKDRLWIPETAEQASEAQAILDEMGRLDLSDPARKAAKDRLKALVTKRSSPPSAPNAAAQAPQTPPQGRAPDEAAAPVAPRSMMKPGFDSDSWQKDRDDRIKASREAGNVHLDAVPAYVETMRGKQIGYVHDPKVKGRILTVDNNGSVYVEWLDAYSQEKEGAVPMKYGNKTVMQTSLGPRDLKDYTLATEGAAAPAPTLKARAEAMKAKRKAVEAPAPAPQPAPAVKANTVFTEDAAAAARARLKAKLGRAQSGIDPETMMDGITLAGYHVEKGARTFAAYARAMVEDLGDAVKPYLQSWYMALRADPKAAAFKADMDKASSIEDMTAADIDALLAEPDAPAAAAPGGLRDHLRAEIAANRMPKDNPALRKMVEAFDGAAPSQARMKEAQEDLEAAIVQQAREIVANNRGDGDNTTFTILKRLYDSQPNLNIRTSTSIDNQAYSTPAPLAYLGARLADVTQQTTMYEPTGGNGMLAITAKPANVTATELDTQRAESLKAQGINVTQGDALKANVPAKSKDRVMTNPPFGPIKNDKGESIKVKFDGYTLGQIDHLIAARALETMTDDGKATLIIGANKATGQQSNNDLIFFNWLYGNYNVTSHFEVEGDLYQRQGAGWPVRVITIQGRMKSATTAPNPATIQRANTWSEVYERFQQGMDAGRDSGRTGAGTVGAGSRRGSDAKPVPGVAAPEVGRTDSSRPEGSAASNGNVPRERAGPVGNRAAEPAPELGERSDAVGSNDQAPGPIEDAGVMVTEAAANAAGNPRTAGVASADPDNQFQTRYIARSDRKDEGVLIPVNMAGPTQDALNRLEDEVGNIDRFAAKELGYKSVAELHRAFMGLQVDSVASAISQIKAGKGIIIADQTGIGKGRQAAGIIRWAAKNGKTPIFVTVKPSLFTDMYGDLHDIGTDDIQPLLMNAGESIKGAGDERLFANQPALHKRVLEGIASSGRLPSGRNALFMTYSQINVDNIQRKAVMALAPNAVFVLDESHNAGGASATGEFIKGALDLASGVTYLSATYAKRPDNMPVYFKTDIGDAVADDDTLMAAMAAGGLPLQTVVSNNLVKAGQMFRRERSYDGVNIESRADTEHKAQHVKLSDETTLALRAIVSADRTFHNAYVKALQKEMAKEGSRVLDMAGNQAQQSVDHTQFSSVVHNFVRQMLLGLKAQEAANDAIRSIKRGEKPLIAVEGTMGSFLAEYAENNNIKPGDSLGSFDYRTVLSRALERSRYIVRQLPNGDKVKEYIPMGKLDPLSFEAYNKAQAIIDKLKIDIPVSPIDWMRDQITKAGYTVAEVTGRNLSVDYSDPKRPTLSQIDQREQKDKVRTTRQFNDGTLDAIILNVAGSTGISLHASEKFKDQRQRHMIVAQAAQDINIFMQMLGRVHRTGQVKLPKYTLLSADLPAEIRPTALLSGKMKSLNANTSSNTESATSVKAADMLNKYGDQIVQQYLADNYELAQALDLTVGEEGADGDGGIEDIARKATGRLALMPVKVQEQFYAEVEEQYQALIDYLNKTNQNDLEPRTFDFDAQETKSEVLFEGQNKASPFGEDALYGEYSVKAQGKAMTPAEIQAAMADHLAGKTATEHIKSIAEPLQAAFLKMRDGMAEEEQKSKADAAARTGAYFLDSHKIGSMFRVDISGESYNAIVTNIRSTHKATGNPFSLSKIQVTIAVNGALRSVTLPATQFSKIEVSRITGGYGASIESAFREGPPNERETAKIVTGNLLGAYGEIEGARGSIITFSKADGTTEQGILLPKAFNFTKDVRQDYRLKTSADVFKFLTNSNNENIDRFGINSRDSVVRVLPSGRDGITIQVPKSKAKGGKYFLDKALREAAGDFVSAGNFMRATVSGEAKAKKALEVLMQKGALYALPSMAQEARQIVGDAETTAQPGTKADSAPLQNIQRIGTQIASMGYEPGDVPNLQASRKLATLVKRLDKGKISEGMFTAAVKMAPEPATTKRGPMAVRAELMAASKRGDIDAESVDFALWALDRNPSLADGLGISVRAPKDGAATGDYNPATAVMRVFKGGEKDDTAVHEIMHHTERMMPEPMQSAIRKEWAAALAKAIKGATPEQRTALGLIPDALNGDKAAYAGLVKAIQEGPLNYEQHYQLVNPSEFWAVNATRLLQRGFDDKGSIWGRIRNYVANMIQKVKGLLGLRSDAPILKALDYLMDPENFGPERGGNFMTDAMLSNTRAMAQDGVLSDIGRTAANRGTEADAIAAGFTLKAYRGVSKARPFNDTGTTWATTNREVAEAYAEEVMGYDDPGVLTVMVKPDGLPRHDASRLTDEQREAMGADDFGNPQAVGIYDRSDDHPLGGSRRNVTVIHAPKDAVWMVDEGANPSILQNIGRAQGDMGKIKQFDVAGKAERTLAHYRSMGMQFLGRRQIVDLWAKDIPALDPYSNMVQAMEAEKNESSAEADAIARDWGNLADEGKLAELMHDATLARADADPEATTDQPDTLQRRALMARFKALSPEAQAVYRKARDAYARHYAKVQMEIRNRIQRSELTSERKQKMLEKMEGEFFKSIEGVYFPLSRFGKYLVLVKDSTGKTINVTRAETVNEADQARRILLREYPQGDGFKVGKVLKDKDFNAARDGVGRGFMAELFESLEKQGAGEELMDSISQLYLSSLPDLSWAKHGIHRKGTPGFSQDARRAFAQNSFHGSRYLAKLRYADQLQAQIQKMQEHVTAQSDNEDFDSIKAQQIVDEMVKRHDTLMNPNTHPVSTALTSVGFVFFLGISPAAAAVNLSQTALVAYPLMGAKWGFGKAAAALGIASKETALAGNDISKVLKGDELAAYKQAVDDGTIDVTMAHDLAGIAQGEDERVTWAMRPVMRAASFLFHHAERFNRQATFVAAFRLAKDAGTDNKAAFEQARDATYKGHFDYGSANRPRIMQGNVAKVVLLFKQYGQNLVYTLMRESYKSLKGLTPQERAEARKAISGILVSHALAAGVLGLPVVGALLEVASFIGSDDDEPWDAESALRNAMADMMGPKASEVIAKGLSRLTPWDISSRVALDRLILPDVREGLEGQDWAEAMAAAALGPVGGIGIGAAKGLQLISDGKYQRGLEAMLPVALRNIVKSYRFESEGNIDRTGIVVNDEVSTTGTVGQALGFAPSEVSLAQEAKSAVYQADRALAQRRSRLMEQFAMAKLQDDEEGANDARQAIMAWNERNPMRRITPAQMMQSVMARRKRIREAEQGIYLPKNRREAMEAGRFAAVEAE